MTEPFHRITDRALLKAIAAHEGSVQTTQAILEGLTEEQATAKPQVSGGCGRNDHGAGGASAGGGNRPRSHSCQRPCWAAAAPARGP